jgi:hypothetical protein
MIIQRMIKFSVRQNSRALDDERPEPRWLFEKLTPYVPEFPAIIRSTGVLVQLIVDYSADGLEDWEGSTTVDASAIPMKIILRMGWPKGESRERILANTLHEVLVHVVPRWEMFQKARAQGKKLAEVFPTVTKDQAHTEAGRLNQSYTDSEHDDKSSWARVLGAALAMTGVSRDLLVFQVMQDIHDHVGEQGLTQVFIKAGASRETYNGYVDGFREHTQALRAKEFAASVQEQRRNQSNTPELSAVEQFLADLE